jgi:dethiobiotin synthetase
MRGLFITGTDTGVGKTHIACEIVRELRAAGHRVGAYKPVCSGAVSGQAGRPIWDDVEALRQALDSDISDDRISPQRFVAPLAPPIAARQEGRTVDVMELQRGFDWWSSRSEIVVVEGAGGLLCPLTDTESMADLAKRFELPLIVVARLGLGTINHTLLTVEVARQCGLHVAGIIFNEPSSAAVNDPSATSNAHEVAARCPVPILGIRRHHALGWVGRFAEPVAVDWLALAGPPHAAALA